MPTKSPTAEERKRTRGVVLTEAGRREWEAHFQIRFAGEWKTLEGTPGVPSPNTIKNFDHGIPIDPPFMKALFKVVGIPNARKGEHFEAPAPKSKTQIALDELRQQHSIQTNKQWSPLCVGRETEFGELQNWLGENDRGACVVTADAGVGKSAFMVMTEARLRQEGFDVYAFYFGPFTNTLDNFTEVIQEERLAFDMKKPRILLIDALDEAESHLESLKWHWDRLGQSVHLIVSVRASDAERTQDLLDLPATLRSSTKNLKRIHLRQLSEQSEICDWLIALSPELRHEEALDLASLVLRRTEGYALYISFLLEDLQNLREGERASFASQLRTEIEAAPVTLPGRSGFNLYISRAWGNLLAHNRKQACLLPVLAAAKRALSVDEIEDILLNKHFTDLSDFQFRTLPRPVQRWIRVTRRESLGSQRFGFAHAILANLFRQDESFAAEVQAEERRLIRIGMDRRAKWKYAAEFLPEHLHENGDWPNLKLLWEDIEYQEIRFQIVGCGHFSNFVVQVAEAAYPSTIFEECRRIVIGCSEGLIAGLFLPTLSSFASATAWQVLASEALDSRNALWFQVKNRPDLLENAGRVLGTTGGNAQCAAVPNGFITFDVDDIVLLWTDNVPKIISERGGYVVSIASVEGGVVTGHHDGHVEKWAGEKRTILTGTGSLVEAIAAVPGGFVTCHWDGTIRLWAEDVPVVVGKTEDRRIRIASIKGGFVTGHEDGSIRRWFGANFEVVGETESYLSCMTSVKDGFVTCHEDGRILRWNNDVTRVVGHIESIVSCVTFVEEDFVTVHKDGMIRRWREDVPTLIGCTRFGATFIVTVNDGFILGEDGGTIWHWRNDVPSLNQIVADQVDCVALGEGGELVTSYWDGSRWDGTVGRLLQ